MCIFIAVKMNNNNVIINSKLPVRARKSSNGENCFMENKLPLDELIQGSGEKIIFYRKKFLRSQMLCYCCLI